MDEREPSRELKAAESRMKQLEAEAKELMTRVKSPTTEWVLVALGPPVQ